MVNVKLELTELEIPSYLIEFLLSFNKMEVTWQQLFDDLLNLTVEDRIRVIEKIRAKKPIAKKKVIEREEFVKPPKFPEIQELAEKILERSRKIICYEGEPQLRERYQEFDERVECKGPATYVCHHCGRNLCSQHSYWIPDIEFPYLVEKTEETEKRKLAAKVKQAAIAGFFGFIFLIIGASIIFMLAMAIPFLILGFLLIIGAAVLYKRAKVGIFYPSFLRVIPTKWEHDKQLTYEHRGYYAAVHCWDCLKVYHEIFFRNASTIFTRIYDEAKTWKRRKGTKRVKIPDHIRYNCAIYAANRFLNEFKFGLEANLPLKNNLRLMVRPDFEARFNSEAIAGTAHYSPTPVWLFWPSLSTRIKRTPSITVADWIDDNRPSIRKKYGVTPGKLDRKKQRKVIKKKNKSRLL